MWWPWPGKGEAPVDEDRQGLRDIGVVPAELAENEILQWAAAYLSEANLPGNDVPAREGAGRRRYPRRWTFKLPAPVTRYRRPRPCFCGWPGCPRGSAERR